MRVILCLALLSVAPARAESGPPTRPKAQLITGGVMVTLGLAAGAAGLAYQPCGISYFGGSHCDWLGSGLGKYSAMIGGASLALAGLITAVVAIIHLARWNAEPPPPEPELRLVPPPPKPFPALSMSVRGPVVRF